MRKKLWVCMLAWMAFVMTQGIVVVHGKRELPLRLVVNNSEVSFRNYQEMPFIDRNGRALVPIRYVAEKLDVRVQWNEQTQEAIFSKNQVTVTLTINKKEYTVNDQNKQMDTSAILQHGRTFIPARYVAQEFGTVVTWDKAVRTVYIRNRSLPQVAVELTPQRLGDPSDPIKGAIYDRTTFLRVQEGYNLEFALSVDWTPEREVFLQRMEVFEELLAERLGPELAKKISDDLRKIKTIRDALYKEIVFGQKKIKVYGSTTYVLAVEVYPDRMDCYFDRKMEC